jgi:hypothetical protein
VSRIPGSGLAKGLAVTAKAMTRRSVTQQYPDVKPELPPRSRGVIALLEENCTVCMLCARECPDWCIYIDSHKETCRPRRRAPRPYAQRPRPLRHRLLALHVLRHLRRGVPRSTRCSGRRSSSTPSSTSATWSTRRTGCASGCGPCRRPPAARLARRAAQGGRRRAQGGCRVPPAVRPRAGGATRAGGAARAGGATRCRRRPAGTDDPRPRPGGTEPPPASEPTLGSTPDELA